MVVKQCKGHGRHATTVGQKSMGNWLFRLFMAWFARGSTTRYR